MAGDRAAVRAGPRSVRALLCGGPAVRAVHDRPLSPRLPVQHAVRAGRAVEAVGAAVEDSHPMDTEQRAAEAGELCTCGRQAVIVYVTEEHGEVGYCGIDGAAGRPVLPCPWCGSSEPHKVPWRDPGKCSKYRLRAAAEGS